MPAQFEIGGVFVPAVLVLAIGALVVFAGLDRLLYRTGFYGWVWHPGLCRMAVLAGVFCVLYLVAF